MCAERVRPPQPEAGRPGSRWVWFVLLWAAGVLTVSGVALVIRTLLRPEVVI